MPVSEVVPPVGMALSLEAVKSQCRLTATNEDDYLSDIVIPAVADRAQAATRRALLTQTWDYVLEEFPRSYYIEIPKPPLVSVTWIKYVDTAGVTQTLPTSGYLVQAPAGARCQRGRIALPFARVWPVTLMQMGAVTIRFVAGYGTSDDIPAQLVMGMVMDASTIYENRESILTGTRAQAIPIPGSTADIYAQFMSYPTQRLTSLDGL